MNISTIKKSTIHIDDELLNNFKKMVNTEGQVIIHFTFQPQEDTYIRIWPTTFLFDKNFPSKRKAIQK